MCIKHSALIPSFTTGFNAFQYFATSALGGMCTKWIKSEVLFVFSRWVMIYPVYINNRRTQEEGRKIAKNKVGVPCASD